MNSLQCPYCGNKKNFFKNVHLIAKVKVSSNGVRGKRLYDINEDEDFMLLYCGECGKVVDDNFYCN